MNNIQIHNKMSRLRKEHEKMMLKVTASTYDLATLELDEKEKEMLETQIYHQKQAADKILERIEYNAREIRKMEAENEQ